MTVLILVAIYISTVGDVYMHMNTLIVDKIVSILKHILRKQDVAHAQTFTMKILPFSGQCV